MVLGKIIGGWPHACVSRDKNRKLIAKDGGRRIYLDLFRWRPRPAVRGEGALEKTEKEAADDNLELSVVFEVFSKRGSKGEENIAS